MPVAERSLRKQAVNPKKMHTIDWALAAAWCGRALALSHGRSGNSAMLSGYMGKKDHAALTKAVRKGTVKVVFEEG